MGKLYYESGGVTLYHGDVLQVLRELPDESVNCCITSPPYYSLRDYGTARWSGGLPDCDHTSNHGKQGATGQRADRTFTARAVYKDECRRCGAKRIDQQIGLEETPDLYIDKLISVFREIRRVLTQDATLWCNIGDSYNAHPGQRKVTDKAGPKQASNTGSVGAASRSIDGMKPKDLIGVPWMLAFALRSDGWYLRQEIIWQKLNCMPESVKDRPTRSHEQLFLLSKSADYFYDWESIQEPASADTHARYARGRSDDHKYANGGPGNQGIAKSFEHMRTRAAGVNPKCAEPGSGIRQNSSFCAAVKDVVEFRNKRSVWPIASDPFPEAHFATFPPALILPCVLAGCPSGGTISDPSVGRPPLPWSPRRMGAKPSGSN